MTSSSPPEFAPSVEALQSIPTVFREQVAKLRSRPMVYSKRDGHWTPLTWSQAGQRVDAAAMGLCALGLAKGDRVAIISSNCVEWVIADLAAVSAGLVDVPMGHELSTELLVWMLSHSGCRLAFVEDAELVQKLAVHREQLPDLEFVIQFHGSTERSPIEGIGLLGLLELEKMGRERALEAELEARWTGLGPDDLLSIIYTSGTTDRPKGVMLTHGNMLANCEACARAISVGADDDVLSVLPLSHSFERMAAYYMAALFGGATIYHAESFDELPRNLGEVKPTIMTAVPRVYEQFHTAAMAAIEQAGPVQKLAFQIGLSGRIEAREAEPSLLSRPVVNLQKRLTRDHILKPFAEQFGGRIRFLICGGAHLSTSIARFYEAAGLTILEGYGLTEAAPVVSVNRLTNYRFGTVGRPLDNVRLRIDTNGEILVKGPNIMKGYWRSEDETEAVLDAHGWLKTGDLGVISRDGYLRLKDRLSDQFMSARGEPVSPQQAESLLVADPMVQQACVAGAGKAYCVALIVPSLEFMRAWAHESGLPFRGLGNMIDDPRLDTYFRRLVNRCNEYLNKSESIGAYHLLEDPFTREAGLLTPTLKLRRKAIIAHYASEIDSLYAIGTRR